jgi:hypothetical protein
MTEEVWTSSYKCFWPALPSLLSLVFLRMPADNTKQAKEDVTNHRSCEASSPASGKTVRIFNAGRDWLFGRTKAYRQCLCDNTSLE